jgi:hypothetical protein
MAKIKARWYFLAFFVLGIVAGQVNGKGNQGSKTSPASTVLVLMGLVSLGIGCWLGVRNVLRARSSRASRSILDSDSEGTSSTASAAPETVNASTPAQRAEAEDASQGDPQQSGEVSQVGQFVPQDAAPPEGSESSEAMPATASGSETPAAPEDGDGQASGPAWSSDEGAGESDVTTAQAPPSSANVEQGSDAGASATAPSAPLIAQHKVTWRERRKEAKAEKAAKAAHEVWEEEVRELAVLYSISSGQSSASVDGLVMKAGEIGVYGMSGASLVEERRQQGHYVGGSQGVSFPIGKVGNRPIRYRVGAYRGHYVPGPVEPTVVDHGEFSITSQRIVFRGSSKTSECLFLKLLAIDEFSGGLRISVSNRQKPTTVEFPASLSDRVHGRLTVALALFHGEAEQVKQQLNEQYEQLMKSEPQIPASPESNHS